MKAVHFVTWVESVEFQTVLNTLKIRDSFKNSKIWKPAVNVSPTFKILPPWKRRSQEILSKGKETLIHDEVRSPWVENCRSSKQETLRQLLWNFYAFSCLFVLLLVLPNLPSPFFTQHINKTHLCSLSKCNFHTDTFSELGWKYMHRCNFFFLNDCHFYKR